MSKQGSLNRIAKYKEAGNKAALEAEEKFYNETYGSVKAEPKVEVKPKK